ncbi:DUF222 domain-containing protein, partial [Kribbella sp. NPDC026596]|uniref:HNH endonuclease signature motif containing protein n=1 Tax=Kribbella sp. NPDC026596 TaxID=3155122 RepID=UPI0033D3C3FC
TLIHTGARPHRTIDGELDPRPRDKRQADALTTALTIAAAATDTGFKLRTTHTTAAAATQPITDTDADTATSATSPTATTITTGPATSLVDRTAATTARIPGFGAKANITVTIDFNDLKTATANAIGDTVYSDGLSAATIRRIACDAKIIPLVLGSNSEPLDVGRAERLVTRAIRRALNTRDKGCVICGAPPVQCDAHHLTSWIDNGPTAIHNLALLCRRHHTDLHNGHWTITITNGVVHVTRPTWADPPPPSRTVQRAHQPRPVQGADLVAAESSPGQPHEPNAGHSRHKSAPPSPPTGPASSGPPRTPPSRTGPPGVTTPPGPGRTPPPSPSTAPPAHNSDVLGNREPDVDHVASSTTTSETTTPSAIVAASPTPDSSSLTTNTTRPGLLHRRLQAEHPEGITPSALREAASLAIWGEPPTPTPEPVASDTTPLPDDPPDDHHDRVADPWQESITTSGPAP